MIAIYKRDLKGFFTGMMGYVLLAFFLAVGGLYFTVMNLMSGYPDLSYTLYNNLFVLLLLVPLLTMRSFAEERRARTDQLLLTSPVSIPAIVAGKFLAQLAVFCVPLTAAAVMPLILTAFGKVSLISAYAALLGYILLGGACLAVGTFISCLTENQIVAYLASFVVLLIAYLMNGIKTMFTSGNILAFVVFALVLLAASAAVGVVCKNILAGGAVLVVGAAALFALFILRPAWLLSAFDAVLTALALFAPYAEIIGGSFSLPVILYYLSVIGVFLFFTGQTLERRRWN